MTYTSVSNVEEYLGTTYDTTTVPTLAQVTSYVSNADEEINNLTGTVFDNPIATTEIITSDYSSNLFITLKQPIFGDVTVSKNTATDKFDTPVWEEVASYNDRFKIKTKYYYMGDRILKLAYSYGFDTVPSDVEYLATLLVAKKILSGEITAQGTTQALSVGPISLTSSIGPATVANMKSEILEYTRRVGRYKRVTL